jgi:hypothetical protein
MERRPYSAAAKLTEEEVAEIRKRYAAGELQRVLADEYQVRQQAISKIVRGERWKVL